MIIERIFKGALPQETGRRVGAVLRARPKLLLCLGCLCLLSFSLMGIVWVRDQARARLEQERARLARQEFIPFEKSVRAPLSRPEIKFWQNTESTRAVARFQDSYFAATDGGLVQFSVEGNTLRHYTVLDGLTESDLVSLAVFDSKLFIGTQSQGLLSFDGERFESYRWLDREPQAITALLADSGRLLIGTFSGGLIEFDGRRFKELKAGANGARLRGINCLSQRGARLYVGTFDDGLWLLEAGRWLHFQGTDGLTSNRVVGVTTGGDQLFVASDFGVATVKADSLLTPCTSQQKCFRTLAIVPSLTGLVSYNGLLLLSKDDGELLALDEESAALSPVSIKNLNWPRPSDLTSTRLKMVEDKPWLMGSRGIWQAQGDALAAGTRSSLSLTPFGQAGNRQQLASNVVSALALDRDGNFWVGNFRRGIDVFTGEGQRITHLESEAVREINFLMPDAGAEIEMLAATSQGLVRFSNQFRGTQLTRADGLPSNSIIGLARDESTNSPGMRAADAGRLVLATGRGLSMNQSGKWRTLTTVQGLPSDQVYATRFFKRALFVGTLGGLAQVEANRVVRVFKDSNSKLTQNWVTALCAAGERLFIGTYGGGLFELSASNEMHGFAEEIGNAVVSPNAMWSDDALLFVGTLDGAWAFDLHSQKWTHLKAELPSRTVLSITGDDRYVYFGTTNGIARMEKSYLEKQG